MTAILCPDRIHRYRLERSVAGATGPVYAYFGVNPSTADAEVDDQTVKKWIGFTTRLGGSRFIVGNAFAFRATNVRELALRVDPVGPENADHLRRIVADADILVPCWGRIGKVPRDLRHHFGSLERLLRESGKPVLHFGLTACGSPKHPQMLGYDTPVTPWPARGTT